MSDDQITVHDTLESDTARKAVLRELDAVPVEKLEDLVQEWDNHGLHPADGGRACEQCAQELQEVIEHYD